MTPIEIAAKAWWDFEVEQSDCSKWDDLTDEYKNQRIRFMRAALLALADAELPRDAIKAGSQAIDWGGELCEDADILVREVLRSIANVNVST